jgi:hypothetical protein
MQAVESRTGIRVFAARDAAHVDYEGLGRLADGAYRHDYAGMARVVFDADHFEWLLEPDRRDWLAVIAVNDDDEPVGCLISLLRTLCYAGREFPALYSTGWTVAPAYRHRNVAMRLARAQTVAFVDADVANRQIGISQFHAGHAGMRAQGVFGGAQTEVGSTGTYAFHRGAMWSRRLLEGEDGSTTACRMSRLSLSDGRLVAAGDVPAPSLDAYRERMAQASVAFAPTESFARFYLRRGNERSGTLLFGFDSPATCIATYSMHNIALDDVDLGRVGQVQYLAPSHCTPQELAAALRELCTFFRDNDCVSACIHDQGGIDTDVLARGGFSRTGDELISNLWATPYATGQGFPGFDRLAPPYLVDFL